MIESRTLDEVVPELVAGADAFLRRAQRLPLDDITATDLATLDTTLVGLARLLAELRRSHDY